MSVNIRTAVPVQDFDSVAEILTLAESELVTQSQLMESHQRPLADGQIRHEIVAELDGKVVGYGTIFTANTMATGHILVKVWTHPDHRKKGIGAQLYDAASTFAQSKGIQTFESNVFDNEPHSLRFAETRGFKIQRHIFESVIDLTSFDASRFDGVIEAVKQTGIGLFSLAEVGNTPENLRKLWEVNYATYMDDPGSTGVFPDFEAFYKMVSQASWFVPESQFWLPMVINISVWRQLVINPKTIRSTT